MLAAAPTSPRLSAERGDLVAANVDAWLDGLVPAALQREGVAGAVVSVVHDGRVVTERGYGAADSGSSEREPQKVDAATTLFRIGSVSKVVTATAVMQLVERGALDLDRPAQDYLDFDLPVRFKTPVTTRHLLSHTAGFEDVIAGVIGDPDQPAPVLRDVVSTDIPVQIYEPGTTPSYSNYSNALAGYIVERVAQQPYADYVESQIFEPSGMRTATLDQPLRAEALPSMSKGYTATGSSDVPFEMVGPAPAGAISATASDMSALMLMQLGHPDSDRVVLSTEALTTMHSPALDETSLGTLAAGPRMTLGLFEQNRNGHRILEHAGDLTAFHADLQLYPDDDAGIFIALNSTGRAGDSSTVIREMVMDGFADRYFADERTPPVSLPTAADHGAAISGDYLVSRRSESTFARLFFLLSAVTISSTPNGETTFSAVADPDGTLTRFTEVEPWVWQEVDGQRRIAVDHADGIPVAVGLNPAFTLLPMPAFQSILLPVIAFSLLVLLIGLVSTPVAAGIRRYYGVRRPADRLDTRLSRGATGARVALVIAGILWAIVADALLTDSPPPGEFVFRGAQIMTALAAAGAVPAIWLVVRRYVNRAGNTGARRWASIAFAVVSAVAFIGIGYVAIVGGLLSPSISY